MPFRSIAADPSDLQKLADAFDAAWISLNAAEAIDPKSASAERDRLSSILINLWQTEPNADLVELGVRRFQDGTAAANSFGDAEPHRKANAQR